MSLRIVIPALNEEKYLPKLLISIKLQDYPCEIVVADAGSSDATRKIAQDFGCKVVAGGLPPKGRNEGAKHANADLILFLDADVILPAGFLATAIKEFEEKRLDIATCSADPLSSNWIDRAVFGLANLAIILFQKYRPFAQGFCLLVRKSLHDRIAGFNERVTFAEDSEYALRASVYGRFGVIGRKIMVSARRFEKEGRLRLLGKYFYFNLARLLFGEIKRPIDYDYGDF